jgi:hypothetical protein
MERLSSIASLCSISVNIGEVGARFKKSNVACDTLQLTQSFRQEVHIDVQSNSQTSTDEECDLSNLNCNMQKLDI